MATKTKWQRPAAPTYPRVIETTYDNLDSELTKAAERVKPSIGNFEVFLRRYRITVELIDEPNDVIQERLRTLWRNTRNHHEREKLATVARKLSFKLDPDEFGADVKDHV